MSKRREFLIRLLLITVIICCSIHTSCGQENDTVNILPPSSLPAKSDFSQEDILNQAQRSFDRSIDLFNMVVTVLGVFGALIALIIVIGGAFGFSEISRLKKLNEEAKKLNNEAGNYVQQTENKAKEATKIVDEAKKYLSDAKPLIERWEKVDKKAENVLDRYREEVKPVSSILATLSKPSPLATLSKPFPEDKKKILDEYGRKMGDFEALGVPLKSEDYLNRGLDLYQREEYELALKAYDKAIELKPDYADAWYNRGFLLGELGRYDEALKAYDKAIELKPDDAYAWDNKGFLLGELGRYDEALEAHNKAIKLKPDFANAWYNKACIYSLKGDKQNALKNLSKATDLDAKHKEDAKSDEDFKNLWDDEDFKRIVS